MQKEFIDDAKTLLLGSRYGERGQLVDEHGNGLEVQSPLPKALFGKSTTCEGSGTTTDCIAESMNHLRNVTIPKILDIVVTEVGKFEKGPVCKVGSHQENRVCDALYYGSLLLGVRQTFTVFHRDATNSMKETLLDLSINIRKNLKFKTIDHFATTVYRPYYHQHPGTGHHSSCERTEMLSDIDSALVNAKRLAEEVFLHRLSQHQA